MLSNTPGGISEYSPTPPPLRENILDLMRNWKFDEAKEIYRVCATKELLEIATLLMADGHVDAARHVVLHLGRECPPALLVRLGDAFWTRQRYSEARGCYVAAFAASPPAEQEQLRARFNFEGKITPGDADWEWLTESAT